MNLSEICKLSCVAASKAKDFIKNERKNFDISTVEEKSFNQLVSYVDKTAEELLVTELSKAFPEAGFITEEGTISSSESEYTWVIDPLDGTTNFIYGVPIFSVSIGLLQNKKPILGVVHEVNNDELFYAWKSGGAYLNNKRICVKENSNMNSALLATGFPYYDFENMDGYLASLSHLMKNSRGMRRMGSAAVDLAYTACGRFDGFFEYGLSPWDVAGGVCLIEEAGGIVIDFEGGEDYLFGKTILGSSKAIFDEFSQIILTNFKTKKS